MLLVIAAAVPLGGCQDKGESKETPASSATAAVTAAVTAAPGMTEVDRVALMERHYDSIIKAHDAVIAGNHAAVRADLLALASQELPAKAPESWRPLHQAMQNVAKRADAITDVKTAAAAVADVAQACGACHKQLGHSPLDNQKPSTPPAAGDVAAKMETHQWATERLWDGVVGPSDSAWQRGAAVLANSSVFTKDGGTVSAELLEQQATLRSLGADAMKSGDTAGRAQQYGRLLATCASCHTQARVTVPATK